MCYVMILTMVRYVFESYKLWCELNMDNWRILQKKRIDYDTENKKWSHFLSFGDGVCCR